MRAGTLLATPVILVFLVHCAAGMPPRATDMAPPREPTSIAEAEAQIRNAERELGSEPKDDGAPQGPAAAPQAPVAKSPASPAAPAPPPAPVTPQSSDTRAGGASPPGRDEPSPCERACRALHSMATAVTSLCRMTGPTDAHCTQARSTLEKNKESARVRACGCPD